MAETDKRLDLVAEQGATMRATLTVNASPPDPLPVAYVPVAQDLSGCTARMQIRSSYGSTSPAIVSLTSSPATGLVLGGTAGTIDVVLTAAQTASIPVRNVAKAVPPTQVYYYDIVVTFPSGDVDRVCYGIVTVYAAVTQ